MSPIPQGDPATSNTALCIVVPAHNEADGLADVLVEIAAAARSMVGAGNYSIIVVDDASTDGTAELLDAFAARSATRADDGDPTAGIDAGALSIVHLEANVGHGPALRAGWELADAEWIAHLDSDGEIVAADLAELWARRADADLVLGVRVGRADAVHRRVVTAVLRGVARVAAGRPLRDANSPCKLVRAPVLSKALAAAPPGAFAPSILLAVTVARTTGRIVEVPVRVRPRAHGRSWLVPTRLARGAARATLETTQLAWRLARQDR